MIANSQAWEAEAIEWLPGFRYLPGFLAAPDALALLGKLERELDWRQLEVRVFGKFRPQPRLTAWCSDPGVSYIYSGLVMEPAPWQPALSELRDRLRSLTGQEFNSVLANAYRDGRDAMGWHADDEPELGPEPCIASLSLGVPRRFLVRAKRKSRRDGISRGLDLGAGDLLVMSGRSQAEWQHSIARTRQPTGLRINLTYRLVRPRTKPG